MTLIFFLGILTGLVIAVIIELVSFWKERNDQGQQMINVLWKIRKVFENRLVGGLFVAIQILETMERFFPTKILRHLNGVL